MIRLITLMLLLVTLNVANAALPSPPLNGSYPIADVDQDGTITPLSDGVLTLRYLFGFRGQSLVSGNIVSANCTRCSATQISTYLASAVETKVLDCENNATVSPLTDGLLFVRHLFGFTGSTLINDVVGSGAQVTTATALQACLNTLTNPVDTTPPVITLTGPDPYVIFVGSGAYSDPGASAVDAVDGVVNVAIDSSQVQTSTVGTYTVTYTASDNAGNSSTATRSVKVDPSPTIAGLIGHWPLNENTGNTTNDQTDSSINLNVNGANWVAGQFGSALEFAGPGSNQDVSTSSAAALQTPSVTISAWVYPDTSSESWEWIASQGDNYGLYLAPTSRKVVFYIKDTTGIWITVESESNIFQFNQWQHVAGTFDLATHTMKAFINGNEVATANYAQGIAHDAGNGFTIGSMQGSRLFNGKIDEVQLYNVALTKAQITQLAQGTVTPPSSNTTLRIYPLGDSITDSINGRPSYRRPLWFLLQNAGYNVDFVGSWARNESGLTDYDLDHDGHAGAEAGDIAHDLNYIPGTTTAPGYLGSVDPDIVLLHIGTNDLDRAQTVASTLTEIDSIIQSLRAKNPSVVIFLAKIIPMRNFDTAVFNAQIDGFIATRTTATSPIIVVDQYTGYDPQTDNYDNYHPNEQGESKMAGKWFAALQGYLAGQLAAQTTTVTPAVNTNALRNPLKGFRWIFKNQEYQTAFPTTAERPYLSLAKWYLAYDVLENNAADDVQKIIDYSNTLWAALPQGNQKVVPRVYLRYGNDASAEDRWPADMTAGDFSSTQFYTRINAFIQKLGQAWDNDPRIAYVEMGILGAWGEQHTPYPTPEMEVLLGDSYTAAFKNKQLLHAGTTDYFRDYPFATYWDSFAHPVEELFIDWLEANRPDSWKSRAYIGEVAYNFGGIENYLGTDPTDTLSTPAYFNRILNYLNRSHNTSLSWIADYNQTAATADGAELVQKKMGYRFLLENVTLPKQVSQGNNFQVSFSIKNEGVAPFYEKWPVELVLLDPTTKQPVWREVFQSADITTWMPGEDWNYDKNDATILGSGYNTPAISYVSTGIFNLPASVPNGEYVVALAVLDPAGMHPSLRFATTNYINGGFHPVARIGVNTLSSSYNAANVTFDDPQLDNSLFYENSVPPAIIVTAPKGNVSWSGGTNQVVSWNSYQVGDFVDIDISLDKGVNWINLVTNTPNDGSESVFIPTNLGTTTARIRVKATNAEDVSNADFTVTN